MNDIMENAKKIVNKAGDLPAMPSVIMNSLKLLNDPTVTVKKIQEQIYTDQALTAYILKIANSALYGVRQEVTTVSYAINLMGYNTTRSILMAFLSKGIFKSQGSKLVQNLLWKHSLTTAIFGKLIAEKVKKINSEEAFISSLLHDIGKGVMFINMTKEFERSVELVFNDNLTTLEAEKNVFGFTHLEVGYLVMKKWGFSDVIVDSLINHHNPLEVADNNYMVPIVSLANKLSKKNGYSYVKFEGDYEELNILGLNEDDIVKIEDMANEEIKKYLEILS